MTKHIIRRINELTAENSRFRLEGVSGTCVALGTTVIDLSFAEERWINGGVLFTQGVNAGDKATLEYVIPGNPEVIVYTYAKDFYLCPGLGKQVELIVDYVSLIPAGIKLRLKYTNTGITSVFVAMNYYTHIPADI